MAGNRATDDVVVMAVLTGHVVGMGKKKHGVVCVLFSHSGARLLAAIAAATTARRPAMMQQRIY